MSLLEELTSKEGEKEIKADIKKQVDKEVSKLREYERLGLIGGA